MAYVISAYIVVLGAMGFYWWTLIIRVNRLGGKTYLASRPDNFGDNRDSGLDK